MYMYMYVYKNILIRREIQYATLRLWYDQHYSTLLRYCRLQGLGSGWNGMTLTVGHSNLISRSPLRWTLDPLRWTLDPLRWTLDPLSFVGFFNDFIYFIIHPTKTASLFGEAKLCHVSHRTWWGFAEGVPQVSRLWGRNNTCWIWSI